MEEYIKHVLDNKTTYALGIKTSFCDESVGDWEFIDVEHAVRHRQNQGRLLVCKDCTKEIIKHLKS